MNKPMMNTPMESFDVPGVYKVSVPYRQVTAIDMGNGVYLKLAGMLGFPSVLSTVKEVSEGTAPRVIRHYRDLVGISPHEQAANIFRNIDHIVAHAARHVGVEIKAKPLLYVVATRVDLVNLDDAIRVNTAYQEAGMPAVARTMVQVAGLPLNAAVEITAEAYLPKNPQLQLVQPQE